MPEVCGLAVLLRRLSARLLRQLLSMLAQPGWRATLPLQSPLHLAINFRSFRHEFGGFFFHAFFQGIILADTLAGSEVAHILSYFHRAKMGAAHGAEMRELRPFLRQGFIMKLLRLIRIEAEIELILPAKLEAGL